MNTKNTRLYPHLCPTLKPEPLNAYHEQLCEEILSPIGFYCIPFSGELLIRQKEGYVWHIIVRRLLKSGYSAQAIAERVGLSEKMIRSLDLHSFQHLEFPIEVKLQFLELHAEMNKPVTPIKTEDLCVPVDC
jgi:hypothetical protein